MIRPVTIAGGGLAGLALGIALKERGIPVTLHEAGIYPRHRVCGEFLSGVSDEILGSLGVAFALTDAVPLRSSCWHDAKGLLRELEVSGRGISRHLLDDRLQERFRRLGGTLITGSRLKGEMRGKQEGLVWAAGRTRGSTDWIGIKCHCRDLPLTHDLEMHVGRSGYVGLARIEGERVNVCGLFRKRGPSVTKDVPLMEYYLAELGLEILRSRIGSALADPSSLCGVSGISFTPMENPGFAVGDAAAMIPPFTGNGMSMALEAAHHAVGPLVDYAEGRIPWSSACRRNRRAAARAFHSRLRIANLLHPLITNPKGAQWVRIPGIRRFLPFSMLYSTLR